MRRRLLWVVLCLLLWSVPLGPTGAIGLDRIPDRLVDAVTRAVEERQPPAGGGSLVVGVIRDVFEGRKTLAPDVEARLAERATNAHLTPREVQVIELISQGMRNKEIAAALGISFETAQVHVKNILGKLKVQDRTAAVSVAVRRGIIQLQ